jgi:cation:H+ antiporter
VTGFFNGYFMHWSLICFYVIAGIALLYYGAEWLVQGGVAIAERLGIPSLIIGLTLVSFATSAPELVVSISAALAGKGDISIGNVVGSNICNIGLILGLSALLTPLAVQKQLLKFDVPLLIAVSLVFAGIGWYFKDFSRLCGILFVLLLTAYIAWSIYAARKAGEEGESSEEKCSLLKAVILVLLGLGALILGGKFLVSGGIAIGVKLGIRDAIIGLTIVAIGTSLPELATSVVAALRKETDIAIGNVVGSNIFNILAIMGITPIISPVRSQSIYCWDWVAMLVLTLLLYPFMKSGMKISRKEGAFYLLLFTGYMVWLVYSAK